MQRQWGDHCENGQIGGKHRTEHMQETDSKVKIKRGEIWCNLGRITKSHGRLATRKVEIKNGVFDDCDQANDQQTTGHFHAVAETPRVEKYQKQGETEGPQFEREKATVTVQVLHHRQTTVYKKN